MKLIIPGIVVTALVLTSPAAFAQMGPGYTSTPGSSVAKDEKTYPTTRSKKHAARHTRHHAKHMGSKTQTTGSGSPSKY
jgi:hypothetical protein